MNYHQNFENQMPLPPLNTNDEQKLHSDINLTDQNPLFIEFKENVKTWLQLDDDIRTLRRAIKERNERKNKLTPEIIAFMDSNKISDLNTQDGKLKFKCTMYKKPLNQKNIQRKLCDFFKNMKKGEEAARYLFENREREEKYRLTRSITKKNNLSI